MEFYFLLLQKLVLSIYSFGEVEFGEGTETFECELNN